MHFSASASKWGPLTSICQVENELELKESYLLVDNYMAPCERCGNYVLSSELVLYFEESSAIYCRSEMKRWGGGEKEVS